MLLYADLKSMFLHCRNRSMFVYVVSSRFTSKSSHNFAVILDGISAFRRVILLVQNITDVFCSRFSGLLREWCTDITETVESHHYSQAVTMPVFKWSYLPKISRLMFHFWSIPRFMVLLYSGFSFVMGTVLFRNLAESD